MKIITREVFPVFKKLFEEVIANVENHNLLIGTPIITRVEKGGKKKRHIHEKKAEKIIKIIKQDTGSEDLRDLTGKRLQALINAALNEDLSINTREYTLDFYAKYVLKKKPYAFSETAPDQDAAGFFWGKYVEYNKDLLLIPNINRTEKEIATRDYMPEYTFNAALKLGGACAGLLGAIFILVIRFFTGTKTTPLNSGYQNLSFEAFSTEIFPIILLFQIILGYFLGWLCGFTSSSKNKWKGGLVFGVSFLAIVFLRQCMVRDAFSNLGGHNTQILSIPGPGLLGEPDFETIATGLMGATGLLFLVRHFRLNKLKVPTIKESLLIMLKCAIAGLVVWGGVYFLYKLLAYYFKLIHTGDYLISPAFFKVDFPHPERPILAALLCVIYISCMIFSLRLSFRRQKIRSDR